MANYYAHPTAEIAADAKIGDGTKVWHQVHIREQVVIGKDCVLSKGVYIDKGVHVGNNVKVQNGVSVYQGVSLEDEVFVGPNASFTNDMFPRSVAPDWKVVDTILRRGASVGANATIVCGIEIGQYAMIAAGAVVTENVLPFALMVGSPARLKGFVCKCGQLLHSKATMLENLTFACKSCGRELGINFSIKEPRR